MATTTMDDNDTWRCWCSTMNIGVATPCSVCTTPKLLVSNNNDAATVDPPQLQEEEEEKKEESSNNNDLLCLVLPKDVNTTTSAGEIVHQCMLTLLSVAWRDYQHAKQHPGHASLVTPQHQLNTTQYNNIAIVTCDDDNNLSKLEARGSVCGIATTTTHNSVVLGLGPAPLEQLHLVLPKMNYLDFKALVDTSNTQKNTVETMKDELQVIQTLLNRVLCKDSATAVEEEKSKAKKKLKPNDKCHCGSGKKYKKCCATSDATTATAPEELPLEEAVTELLLNASKSSSSSSSTNNATCTTDLLSPTETKGEKVASYRKQVEYGAKKYIKP